MFGLVDRNTEWTTKEGVKIKIKDMETSHIKNTLNMLKRENGKTVKIDRRLSVHPTNEHGELWHTVDNKDWINILEKELEYRKYLAGKSELEVISYFLRKELKEQGWI